MFDWFNHPIHTRAPAGGEIGCDGTFRRGGEFEPFYVPRPEMPQIDEADLPDLVAFVSTQGVEVVEASFPAIELHFHQRVDHARIRSMPEEVYRKPILVSQDLYVLDGNHRATAHKVRGDEAPCLVIQADFENAMQILFSFPKTYVLDATQTQIRN